MSNKHYEIKIYEAVTSFLFHNMRNALTRIIVKCSILTCCAVSHAVAKWRADSISDS